MKCVQCYEEMEGFDSISLVFRCLSPKCPNFNLLQGVILNKIL